MNIRTFSNALTLTAILFSIASCTKNEVVNIDPPVEVAAPSIPDGNRVIIHFGTSTYRGCMNSFSNCIWIGWGTDLTNSDLRLALQFDQGDAAGQYFGQYFPLTADYIVDGAEAQALGVPEQVIRAGFYPVREVSSGLPTGKRQVQFDPAASFPVASLINPNNPQDNVGQLHNLAVQVVLNDNRDELLALKGDKKAIQKLVAEKTIQFMAEAELPLSATEQQYTLAVDLNRDYHDYAARLNETRLSANDKKLLLDIFDEAAAMKVGSPDELNAFMKLMTERENQLVANAKMDNPKTVLSMVSVLKNSRYFWFWKSIATANPGSGNPEPAGIPNWVWADIIGMEIGGPVVSAIASAVVYLDER